MTAMGYIRVILAAAALLLTPLVCLAGAPYRVDGIEAVVDEEVITTSDLDAAVAFRAVRSGVSANDPDFRRAVLDSMIDRMLLLNEAEKFNIVDVSDEEVDAAMVSLVDRFGSAEALAEELAKADMSLEDLRRNVRDQITTVKYVDRRIRFFVRVTLDDQKRYYAEHEQDFGGRPFADVAEDIRALLVERQTNEKLDEYLESLREKADIRFPGD